MLINSSVPNLIGGVSQQPELLRLPSHLRAQENGYSTASKGLAKRAPTNHKGVITSFSGNGFHQTLDFGSRGVFHMEVDAGAGTSRVVTEGGNPVNLYDSTGAVLGSMAYLTTATPDTSLKVVQEADTAFLINTDVVVQEQLMSPAVNVWMALIWIKTGNYGRDYSVYIPGKGTATYSTPDGSVASHVYQTKTSEIANSLGGQLTTMGVPGVVVKGSIITLTQGGYEGMVVNDGYGGNAMGLAWKNVRGISDLPSTNAADGFTVQIEGGDATGAGDHYLTWSAADNVYKETTKPLEWTPGPKASSMPLMMQPYLDGFKVSTITWNARKVGDSNTNASPTFIGKTINDICFYQDRMVVVSGEDFNISEVGEYYNFYRTTVTDLLDSDPIIGSVSHPKVSTLRHAVPFNKRLLMFSDKAQFELSAGDFITPKNFASAVLTQFECSSLVRPVGVGNSLYFAVDRGDFSAFYNFFVNGVDSLEDALDVSGHVPKYLPAKITQTGVSPVNNLIIALSADEAANLYLYQFYQDGQQRLQSAWHRWPVVPGGSVLSMAVVNNRLCLLTRRPTGTGFAVCSESISLGPDNREYRLDRKVKIAAAGLTVTGSGLSKVTQFSLPYLAGAGTYFAVVTTGNTRFKAGSIIRTTTTPGSAAVTMRGDFTGCVLEVGLEYDFRATLGRFMVREQAGNGSTGVARGRTQVGRMWVNYSDTSTFTVEVAATARPLKSYTCTGRTLGTDSATIGAAMQGADGRFMVPIQAQNTAVEVTLVNSTPMPSSFLGVDWEGYHVDRGQHV